MSTLPVSYEVARQMLEDAETPEQLDQAIKACAEGLVNKLVALDEDSQH